MKNSENDNDFSADKISEWLQKYWHLFVAGLVAAGVIWGGVVAYQMWWETQEKDAQERLFTLKKKLEDKQSEILKAESEPKNDGKSKKKAEPKQAERTPEKLKADFGPIIDDYRKFIVDNSKYSAAAMAAIELAGLAVSHKAWDLAAEVLSKAENSVRKNSLFYGLVHGQWGTVLMELGKFKDAIAHFELIVASEELSYAHPEALLRKASSHIELKEWDQAEAALSKIESEAPATQAAMTAKGLKRLLQLRKSEG